MSAGVCRTVYFVVGESSGDALGADLIRHLQALDGSLRFIGLGGEKMRSLGLASLFDISAISVMGLSQVVANLPSLAMRIRQTAKDIIARRPDLIILIDSPEFSFRVARRVKKSLPSVPVVKYVCPSVWAWRPGRARQMAAFLDHILAILPFEPELLKTLGGPSASYIGHPLAWPPHDASSNSPRPESERNTVLLLPGSRRSEVRLLLSDMGRTLEILHSLRPEIRAVLPAVPHLADEIAAQVAGWPVKPEIVIGEEAKIAAFAQADVALAASGTVLLELALHRIPAISIYRLDWLMWCFRSMITGWTAALPNLIADRPIIPERINDNIRPGWLARALRDLLRDGPAREAQLAGFEEMAAIMRQDEAPGALAAQKLLALMSPSG